jgi:glycosyltransferase involved in cell wall biosynthesis
MSSKVEHRPGLVLLISAGMGGANAWAFRLRDRLGPTRQVSVVCRGDSADLVEEPDFVYERSRDLSRYLQQKAPSIVFPNWMWNAFRVCTYLRARGVALRTVAYCRSHSEDAYYSPIASNLSHIDWIVAVSEVCYQTLTDQFPHRSSRILLIPTFVERAESMDRIVENRPLRLLYTGRFEQKDKRVLDLITLGNVLVQHNVDFTLTLAGRGSRTLDILRAMARVPHKGRIRVIGELPPRDIPALLRDHDVFVQTSEVEGLSNSMLEAMAFGVVPLVSRASSGVDGVVFHDVNGLVVSIGDIEGMAGQVQRLANDPKLLKRLAAAAYSSTRGYSWSAFRNRFGHFLSMVEAQW